MQGRVLHWIHYHPCPVSLLLLICYPYISLHL